MDILCPDCKTPLEYWDEKIICANENCNRYTVFVKLEELPRSNTNE